MENIVDLNEDEVFKTLQICRVIKGNHMGVLCVGTFSMKDYLKLQQYSNNVHTMIIAACKMNIALIGYDYYGSVPEQCVMSELLTEEEPEYKAIKSKRTLRKESSIWPILNFKYPDLNLNSVELINEFTYSEPFLKYNGKVICMWKPLHQDTLSKENFRIKDDCLVYSYKKPIYILTTDAKRHLSTEFCETFIVGLKNHRITRECNYINKDSVFVFGRYALDANNLWGTIKQSSKHIMGSKTQISTTKMVG